MTSKSPGSITLTVALLLAIFSSQSCGPASGDDVRPIAEPKPPPKVENKEPVGVDTVLDCKEGTTLDYDNFGEAFFLGYCTSCHSSDLEEPERTGAPLDVNLDSLDDIQILRQKILASAGRSEGNTMPPADHVPASQRQMLAQWLNCGAPGGKENLE